MKKARMKALKKIRAEERAKGIKANKEPEQAPKKIPSRQPPPNRAPKLYSKPQKLAQKQAQISMEQKRMLERKRMAPPVRNDPNLVCFNPLIQ